MNAGSHRIDDFLEVAADPRPSSGKREVPPHLRAMRSRADGGAFAETLAALDTVMVATDFSEHAVHAASRVAMLTDEVNLSKATVLHVLEEQRLVSPTFDSQRMRRTRRHLAAVADQLRQRSGLTVEGHFATGSVVETIQRFAASADLVVLGAQGAHPIRDFVIGSTAQRVLRKTLRPVLVVRRRAEGPYRQVLIAVDFQSDASNALDCAQALAPQAKLNLVHAYDVPFEGKMRYAGVSRDVISSYRASAYAAAARNMRDLILSRVPSTAVRPLIVHGDAVTKLLEMERELNADMIVVTKGNKSRSEELLWESVTSKLIEGAKCDVLVVR